MSSESPAFQVLVASIDEASAGACLVLARNMRAWGISCVVDGRTVRLKKKFQWANDVHAYYVIVIGPDDIAAGTAQVRDLDENVQETIPVADIPRRLASQLVDPDELHHIESRRAIEAFNRSGDIAL